VRAAPVALTLMDQARAWKHDTAPGNRLTDQAAGLLGSDAVLTIIGQRNAGKLPDCGMPACAAKGSGPAWMPGPASLALPDPPASGVPGAG
jgi:hypothetical protein